MLLELRVENLLLIERAELRFERGLNVITGETGAGKTMLAHALDLLLGGRPRPASVRPGTRDAYVEGVFAAGPDLLAGDALVDVRERVGELGEELVLARRVSAEGRSRAFVQGRSASAGDLAALGERLLSFYGQHEHRRLTLASAQLDILDGFCGPQQLELRGRLSRRHAEVRSLERDRAELEDRAGARERDRDLLAFELAEIEALAPTLEDGRELATERDRLRAVDALRTASAGAAEALDPSSDDAGLALALAEAERLCGLAAGADAQLDALAARLGALRIEAGDLASDLRGYESGLEADPERLEQIESRLAEYERLKRKHGGELTGVLAHAERCRAELGALGRASEDAAGLDARLAAARAEEHALAERATRARRSAAPELARRVEKELAELAMGDAEFEVRLAARDELAATGAERVELLIAPNPGVPATPLRETASGGELSRTMLALLTAAGSGGETTLVFDEIDAGIGGQTARAVGERLRTLARDRQVVCITHLPQIASMARRHFRIEKSADGGVATTAVAALADGEVVAELCRMLGADASDPGARRHARELLAV